MIPKAYLLKLIQLCFYAKKWCSYLGWQYYYTLGVWNFVLSFAGNSGELDKDHLENGNSDLQTAEGNDDGEHEEWEAWGENDSIVKCNRRGEHCLVDCETFFLWWRLDSLTFSHSVVLWDSLHHLSWRRPTWLQRKKKVSWNKHFFYSFSLTEISQKQSVLQVNLFNKIF